MARTAEMLGPYNDGLVSIYGVQNRAEPGERPEEFLEYKGRLRFYRRTVGFTRFYAAQQADQRVDLLLRVPWRPYIDAMDIAVPTIDGKQYRIIQVQQPEDVTPAALDLTLQRVEHAFPVAREGSEQ